SLHRPLAASGRRGLGCHRRPRGQQESTIGGVGNGAGISLVTTGGRSMVYHSSGGGGAVLVRGKPDGARTASGSGAGHSNAAGRGTGRTSAANPRCSPRRNGGARWGRVQRARPLLARLVCSE